MRTRTADRVRRLTRTSPPDVHAVHVSAALPVEAEAVQADSARSELRSKAVVVGAALLAACSAAQRRLRRQAASSGKRAPLARNSSHAALLHVREEVVGLHHEGAPGVVFQNRGERLARLGVLLHLEVDLSK